MCAEKLQRILMALVLSVALFFVIAGQNSIAIVVLAFMIAMVLVWAVVDFCPSLWVFKRLLGSCYDKR